MTRRNEGEAVFEALGQSWRLCFDMNVMIDFAEATGRAHLPLAEVVGFLDFDRLTPADMRTLVFLMLQEHQPEVTLRDAGRVMLLPEAVAAFNRAMLSAMPTAATLGDEADAAGKSPATPSRVA